MYKAFDAIAEAVIKADQLMQQGIAPDVAAHQATKIEERAELIVVLLQARDAVAWAEAHLRHDPYPVIESRRKKIPYVGSDRGSAV